MALTRDEVRHLARLARLSLTEADIGKFQEQLSEILEYFQRLSEVDTEGIPPTPYPLPLHNVMRDDQPSPPMPATEVLANAPSREDDFFRVNAVLEE